MYLKRMELQGFKTFASKTVLEFELDKNGRRGMTGIVGPNGSGKSNIADAARWVMGEQSLKLLRCKKSEDVIFSGTEKKPRSGFAEVSMTLENDDKPELDYSEIVITRRLYRDGQSEYEINKQGARLTDVVMLLAQAGIGQRSYSVIGQGMVDDVLSATPTERKVFFDEAAGLRPFQLKRQSSMNKLDASRDNLRQSELLIREIQPRLITLERQVKRLEKRETLESDLALLETQYYGAMWRNLEAALNTAKATRDKAAKEADDATVEAEKSEAELRTMESANPPSEEFGKLRASLNQLMEERTKLRERQFKLEASVEVAKVRAEKPWAPLPLSKIISSIELLGKDQDALLEAIESDKTDIAKIKQLASVIRQQITELTSKLQRPAPEPEQEKDADPKLKKEMEDLLSSMDDITHQIQSVQKELEEWNAKEQKNRSHIFEVQRLLSAKRSEASRAESRKSQAAVELARIETRRDAFLIDVRTHIPEKESELSSLATQVTDVANPESLAPQLAKLRAQLEWIGGIDPETIKEYEETKKRYEELSTQTEDLVGAMASLETIIKELDLTISERSRVAFRKLNHEFGLYFKKLFNGGEAGLGEVFPEPEVDEEGNIVKPVSSTAGPVGIDIHATPPGKRLKSIALLSGGERALCSIALICAIMATNPSPFVVLDEVDAALDESNSHKFAEIISSLADQTQFVIVTHNRATMERAHILYGVSMGDNGTSQLLSVKIQDMLKK
jgi:chromosome segregation ATPase